MANEQVPRVGRVAWTDLTVDQAELVRDSGAVAALHQAAQEAEGSD
jgi:hypothetical protein